MRAAWCGRTGKEQAEKAQRARSSRGSDGLEVQPPPIVLGNRPMVVTSLSFLNHSIAMPCSPRKSKEISTLGDRPRAANQSLLDLWNRSCLPELRRPAQNAAGHSWTTHALDEDKRPALRPPCFCSSSLWSSTTSTAGICQSPRPC